MRGPTFSVREIPFSYRGSWFDISPVTADKTYAEDLHLVSHQTGMHAVLRLVPALDDHRATTRIVATPSLLTWHHEDDETRRVEAAYQDAGTLRIRGLGLGLRLEVTATTLTSFSGGYLYRDPVDDAFVLTSYETGRRYRISVRTPVPLRSAGLEALGSADRHISLPADEPWEITIQEHPAPPGAQGAGLSFDDTVTAAAARFTDFVDAVAPWRSAATPAAELAGYVLWSATVDPAGFLTRPGVLMSKHWMDKIWSWDHCFNALALAGGEPALAWDQFQLPFDHQDSTGALPDSVTHSEVLYNFVKPPVHGWALRLLRPRLGLEHEQLATAYHQLTAWTRFWLDRRRTPGHLLAHYQHGNDSGWDNATTFDHDRLIETADLSALLVLQLRELADLAAHLGRTDQAEQWRRNAQEIADALVAGLWQDDQFVARSAVTGRPYRSRSLLNLMPIVLGAELPQHISVSLAERLAEHLTEHGLATEPVNSPDYAADGYWRGPIWAPTTVLIEDGLRRAGHHELADTISARFRLLCEKSGFAENFDAQTGAGLRDRAYTWTASSYLILAAAHHERVA